MACLGDGKDVRLQQHWEPWQIRERHDAQEVTDVTDHVFGGRIKGHRQTRDSKLGSATNQVVQ